MFSYVYSLFYGDNLSPFEQLLEETRTKLHHREVRPPVYSGITKEAPLPAIARNATCDLSALYSCISLSEVLDARNSLRKVRTREPLTNFAEPEIFLLIREKARMLACR